MEDDPNKKYISRILLPFEAEDEDEDEEDEQDERFTV